MGPNCLTIGLLLTLVASGQAHLNIFLNLHEVLRLIGEFSRPYFTFILGK